jgi:hypothetical protein
MAHSYDHISLFVSFFDIPVSLDDMFQRIASIIFVLLKSKKLSQDQALFL